MKKIEEYYVPWVKGTGVEEARAEANDVERESEPALGESAGSDR